MAAVMQLPHPLHHSLLLLMGCSTCEPLIQVGCLCDGLCFHSYVRSLCLRGTSRKRQGALGPSHSDQRVPGMKLGAACLLCLLLTCLTLPVTHSRVYEHSMEIRSKESRSKGLPPAPSAFPGSAAYGGAGGLYAGAKVCFETAAAVAFIPTPPSFSHSPGVYHAPHSWVQCHVPPLCPPLHHPLTVPWLLPCRP